MHRLLIDLTTLSHCNRSLECALNHLGPLSSSFEYLYQEINTWTLLVLCSNCLPASIDLCHAIPFTVTLASQNSASATSSFSALDSLLTLLH